MAEVNYLNPSAINPGTAYKPSGVLGGYIWGEDRQRYDALAPLQDLMSMLSAQEQMNKMQEYGQNAPVREAERAEKIAKSSATAETFGPKLRGENEKLNLSNQYDRETLQTRMKEKLLDVSTKELKGGGQKLKLGAQIAYALSKAAGSGPAASAAVIAKAKELGIDPNDETIQAIIRAPTPQAIEQAAQAVFGAFDQADSEYRRTMAEQELKTKSAMDVAKEHSRGQIAAANIRSQQQKKDVQTMVIQGLTRGADTSKLSIAAGAEDHPDLDAATKQMAKRIGEQALRNITTSLGINYMELGNPTESLTARVERLQARMQGGQQPGAGPNADPLGLFK